MNIINKCTMCHVVKEEKEFDFFHGKRNIQCRKCRAKHNKFYAENKDGYKTRRKEYYSAHKRQHHERMFKNNLKRRFSLSIEDYERMKAEQNNKCAICQEEFAKRPSKAKDHYACVDHDHATGKVRALLCRKCNLNLHAIENKDFVQKATIYLSEHLK